jgi:hypothetical protein
MSTALVAQRVRSVAARSWHSYSPIAASRSQYTASAKRGFVDCGGVEMFAAFRIA